MSPAVRAKEPVLRQIFIGRGPDVIVPDALERKLYVIRKTASSAIQALKLKHSREYYVPSMSCRTVIYKGLLLADQVGKYYKDLHDPRAASRRWRWCTSASRPTPSPSGRWRTRTAMVAHNGEINTVKGNFNWMRAREGVMKSPVLGDDLKKLYPISFEGQSRHRDLRQRARAADDERLLARPRRDDDDPRGVGAAHRRWTSAARAFYEYHAAMLEPWDGPAAMVFTDGRQIGATLDRNGLRPARYIVTDDDLVVMASESGVLPIPENKIVKKWRLQPGKMFLIDLEQGRIVDDEELKNQFASAKPYRQWIESVRIKLEDVPDDAGARRASTSRLLDRQQAFGYTQEDIKFLMSPMAQAGEEGIGSMGNDSPLAVLSDKNKPLYNYFKQLFAQVTNPPIDPIREAIVMSLVSFIGPKPNLLDINAVNPPMRLEVRAADPRLRRHGAAARHRDAHRAASSRATSSTSPTRSPGATKASRRSSPRCAPRAVDAIKQRPQHPDHQRPRAWTASRSRSRRCWRCRRSTSTWCAKACARPPASSSRPARRARCITSRVLAGYGAEAVHPVPRDRDAGRRCTRSCPATSAPTRRSTTTSRRSARACRRSCRRWACRPTCRTAARSCSRRSASRRTLVDKYFRGTASQVGGIGVFEVAEEAIRMHRAAFGDDPVLDGMLDAGGEYAWRVRGEEHMWTPDAIAKLQHSARANNFEHLQGIRAAHQRPDPQRHMTLRGLFEFKRRSGEGDSARRGRAGERDRQALRHRRDVARLDLAPRRTPRSPSR